MTTKKKKKTATSKTPTRAPARRTLINDLAGSLDAEKLKALLNDGITQQLEDMFENISDDDLYDALTELLKTKTTALIKSGKFDDEVEKAAEAALKRRLKELAR